MTAEDRAALIMAVSGRRIFDLRARVERAVKSQAPRERKYFLLTKIADEALRRVSPQMPCRRGCAACCHIAVPIALSEARGLASASGKTLSESAGLPLSLD